MRQGCAVLLLIAMIGGLAKSCMEPEKEELNSPTGASSQAEEMAATMINAAGYLCADITNAYQVGDTLIVDCVEYRSGAGRAKYGIDLKTGSVRRM